MMRIYLFIFDSTTVRLGVQNPMYCSTSRSENDVYYVYDKVIKSRFQNGAVLYMNSKRAKDLAQELRSVVHFIRAEDLDGVIPVVRGIPLREFSMLVSPVGLSPLRRYQSSPPPITQIRAVFSEKVPETMPKPIICEGKEEVLFW